jgi:hypothetical protein
MFKHVQILLEPELRDASGFQCRRHSRHRGSGLSLCQCSMATAHGARHTPLLHYTLQPQNYLRVSMYNIYIHIVSVGMQFVQITNMFTKSCDSIQVNRLIVWYRLLSLSNDPSAWTVCLLRPRAPALQILAKRPAVHRSSKASSIIQHFQFSWSFLEHLLDLDKDTCAFLAFSTYSLRRSYNLVPMLQFYDFTMLCLSAEV